MLYHDIESLLTSRLGAPNVTGSTGYPCTQWRQSDGRTIKLLRLQGCSYVGLSVVSNGCILTDDCVRVTNTPADLDAWLARHLPPPAPLLPAVSEAGARMNYGRGPGYSRYERAYASEAQPGDYVCWKRQHRDRETDFLVLRVEPYNDRGDFYLHYQGEPGQPPFKRDYSRSWTDRVVLRRREDLPPPRCYDPAPAGDTVPTWKRDALDRESIAFQVLTASRGYQPVPRDEVGEELERTSLLWHRNHRDPGSFRWTP